MAMSVIIKPEPAPELPPFGKCGTCGVVEDAMVAIFWRTDANGIAHCPECCHEAPGEGYRHHVLVSRKDRPGELPYMHGPYSAGEALRMQAHFMRFDNVQSAEILPPEGE